MAISHFTHERVKRIDKTPDEWLPVGGQLSDIVNGWSNRSDIVAFVGEGAGHGAAACFVPDIAEMEVDVKAAFGEGTDPDFIPDLTERDNQFDYAAAVGAVFHEAAHAKHSRWDMRECMEKVLKEDKDPFAYDIITNLEESRAESRLVKVYKNNKPLLRSCVLKLVLGDIKADTDFSQRGHQSMSKLILLSMPRLEYGALKRRDIKPIIEAAEKLYGQPLLDEMRRLWLAAQGAGDEDWETLYKLALEWIKLLEDAGHSPRDENKVPDWVKDLLKQMQGTPAPGQGDDGEKGPGGEGGVIVVGILEEMADEAETAGTAEGFDQSVKEMMEEQAKAKEAAGQEAKAHQDAAQQCFGKGRGPGPSNTSSRLVKQRPPTDAERAAAVQLSKLLDRAKYRDRVIEEKAAKVPPGKLRGRTLMQGQAMRERGMVDTTEPFNSKRRHHAVDPNLTIGMLTDISGSMGRAMEPMGSAAYVASEAARRIQGTIASVYFGNDVFPVLAPGDHLKTVDIYSCPDGTHRFDKGFKAINGKLGLLGGTGARLLIVTSDLHHEYHENDAAREWFRRCKADGVAVIVIAPDTSSLRNIEDIVGANGSVMVLDDEDIVGTAKMIGQAAIKELERASR